MKQVRNEDFNNDVVVYSGIRDIFGNPCLLLVNELMGELRIVSKNKDYSKEQKRLKSMGCSYVRVQKYGEVINIAKSTACNILKEFPGYKHTQWIVT